MIGATLKKRSLFFDLSSSQDQKNGLLVIIIIIIIVFFLQAEKMIFFLFKKLTRPKMNPLKIITIIRTMIIFVFHKSKK